MAVRLRPDPRLRDGSNPTTDRKVSGTKIVRSLNATVPLSETFAALANPTRRAILAHLAQGEATLNELAEPFHLTLPAISKHIKTLERAGLVTRGHLAQYRPCALDASPLAEVATWAEQYRPIWESRLDRMADYLTQLRSQRMTEGHDD